MAAFRAVENGATLVRSARWGTSTIVTPYGREIAAVDHVVGSGKRLTATVTPAGRRTMYPRVGDVVAVAATGAAVTASIAAGLVRLLG